MLKLLLSVMKLFIGALGLFFLSLVLHLLGYVYDYPQFLQTSTYMEIAASLLLVCSVTIGGGLGLVGVLANWLGIVPFARTQREKVKNGEQGSVSKHSRERVEAMLESLTQRERSVLRVKLARSRLAIRVDGTLIDRDQTDNLMKAEQIIEV